MTTYDDLWRFMTFYVSGIKIETEIVIKCRKLSWHVVNCRDVCRKLSWHFFSRPLPAVPFWISPNYLRHSSPRGPACVFWYSETWEPPQFWKKTLSEWKGHSRSNSRNSGVFSEQFSEWHSRPNLCENPILGATLGATLGIGWTPKFQPKFSERFFQNWGGSRAPEICFAFLSARLGAQVPVLHTEVPVWGLKCRFKKKEEKSNCLEKPLRAVP